MVWGSDEPAITAAVPLWGWSWAGWVGWDPGLHGPEASQASITCDTQLLFIKCLLEAGKGPLGDLFVGFTFPGEAQRSLAVGEVHTAGARVEIAQSDGRAHALSTAPSCGHSIPCHSRL